MAAKLREESAKCTECSTWRESAEKAEERVRELEERVRDYEYKFELIKSIVP